MDSFSKIYTFEDRRQSYFEEIDIPNTSSCLILLDLDGTLMPDLPGDTAIGNAVREKIAQLSAHHRIYLCTNGKDRARVRKIATDLGIQFIDNKYKKPNRKIINDIPYDDQNRRTIVIGDKILTDGLLAKKLRASFYLVKRKKSNKERLFVRLSQYLDDIVTAIFIPLS